jgi:DNA repair protein RecN (Recombination protein N)
MLAGMDDTETGRAHAEELLATAEKAKAEPAPKPKRGSKKK